MAINTISYTVSALGLEPNTKQYCGVQGDHNIYRLEFNIDSVLWNKLQEQTASGGTLYYRFDLYNGEGANTSTSPQTLENSVITFDVEEWLTRFGGVGKAVLVITLSEDGITYSELYSSSALLRFKNRPTGSEPNEEEYQSMTTLAVKAKKAAEDAEAARLQAQIASDSANDVRTALNKGMILKLNGQRADGTAEIFDTISDKVTETGENAVAGAAIYAELIKIKEGLKETINSIKAEAKLEAHPKGSLYWSSDSTNPKKFLGGEWEQIEGAFIYAAKKDDEIGGDIKGNENGKVTLDAENIAQHTHTGLFYAPSSLPIGMAGNSAKTPGYAFPWTNSEVYSSASMITGGNLEEGIEPSPIDIMPPYVAYYCWIRVE